MSFHTPRDWTTGETVTEEMLDEQIKDNMNELWKYTTNGDMVYATSGSTTVRLPIGSAGQVLSVVSGVPSWATLFGQRQGGDATEWYVNGTTNYATNGLLIQFGAILVSTNNNQYTGTQVITFPTAYADEPFVGLLRTNYDATLEGYGRSAISTTGFTITVKSTLNVGVNAYSLGWIAIGPTA